MKKHFLLNPAPTHATCGINISGRGNACCRSSSRCSGSSPWAQPPSQARSNRRRWMQGDSKPSTETQAFGRMQGSVQGQGGSLGLQPGSTHSVAQRGRSRVPVGWRGPAGEGKQHTACVEPLDLARRLKQLGLFFPTVTTSFQALPGLASSLASPLGSRRVCQG